MINGPVSSWLSSILSFFSAPAWLNSLVVNGIVAGVGGVLVFVPGLLILYFFLALLENSGYMSRAAFVMDRFMRIVGLHGKSFIPMILGFGCAVPAVYATRTIASRRDRLLTALLVPLNVLFGAVACLCRIWTGLLRLAGRNRHLGDVRTWHHRCHDGQEWFLPAPSSSQMSPPHLCWNCRPTVSQH